MFLLLPILVGSAVSDLGFSEGQAGLLASSYFAGYMLIGISAIFWIRRVSWRKLAIAAYVSLALGLAIAGCLTGLYALAAVLFAAGCAAGVLFGLGVTMISDTEKPDRNFGFVLATQQLLAAMLLFTLPDLVVVHWGFQGLNLVMAAVLGALGLSAIWIPQNSLHVSPGDAIISNTGPASSRAVWICLAALSLYFAALSGVWAFVERLADGNGLSISQVGGALAVAMAGGVLGGLGAVVVGRRWGRTIPLIGSTLLFVGVFLFYSEGFQVGGFALATFLFVAAWNYVLAYQMAIISELDREGRFAVLMPAAQALGAILGPGLAGVMIHNMGYTPLFWAASVCIAMAILPFIFLKAQPALSDQLVLER